MKFLTRALLVLGLACWTVVGMALLVRDPVDWALDRTATAMDYRRFHHEFARGDEDGFDAVVNYIGRDLLFAKACLPQIDRYQVVVFVRRDPLPPPPKAPMLARHFE